MNGDLDAQAEAVQAAPRPGTGGSNAHPYQTAMVFSLRTGIAGASGRGRLYWPATGTVITASTLRIQASNVTSALSGAKTYLSGINAAIETTLGGAALGVWSRTKVETYAVTSLQCGDVADVQRRRRDQLIESYSALTYP